MNNNCAKAKTGFLRNGIFASILLGYNTFLDSLPGHSFNQTGNIKVIKKTTDTMWMYSLLVVLLAISLIFGGCQGNSGSGSGSEDPNSTSDAKAITAFGFTAANNSSLSVEATGIIDEAESTITVDIPFLTDDTSLVATFSITGASVAVIDAIQSSGVTENNFSEPVVYTVTAADGSTKNYTVTTSETPSDAKAISAFAFPAASNSSLSVDGAGVINEAEGTIAIVLPFQTDNTSLVATFSTTGASVAVVDTIQSSGVTENNFSGPVVYTVTAADGSTKNYAVTTSEHPSDAKAITAFGFTVANNSSLSVDVAGVISKAEGTIAIDLPFLTDNTSLVATFSTTGTSVTVIDAIQSSGVTGNNFSSPVIYTLTAADGSTKEYTVTTTKLLLNHQAYLKALNNSNEDKFGYPVAISGNTLVVGAYQEDSSTNSIIHGDDLSATNDSGLENGAVYIFKRSGLTWALEAYLKAPNNSNEDNFGASVAIDGDTVVVGVSYENSNTGSIIHGSDLSGTNNSGMVNGAAYVFKRTGSTWSHEAYLKSPNTSYYDRFGSSVAIDGDTIVVGAVGEDGTAGSIIHGSNLSATNDSGSENGAAYVFKRTGSTWVHEAYLKAPNTSELDNFGSSVAIDGDTVVVGAKWEGSATNSIIHGSDLSGTNDSGEYNGAVYVFKRTGSTWLHEAYLKAPNTSNRDAFGNYAAIDGDTIVVGAFGEDSTTGSIIHGIDLSGTNDSGSANGAAYVFKRTGSTWVHEAYLKVPNTSQEDFFGNSIAIDGNTLLVRATGEDSNTNTIIYGGDLSAANDAGDNNGAVYLFKRTGSIWTHEAYIKAPNTSDSDSFGVSVALDGDTIVVGASLESSNTNTIIHGSDLSATNDDGLNNGAVYIFR